MTNKVDWAAHLQAIETEGISIKDYAARGGLSVASLYYPPSAGLGRRQAYGRGFGPGCRPAGRAARHPTLHCVACAGCAHGACLAAFAAVAGTAGGQHERTGALMHPGCHIDNVYLCREPVDFRKSIGGLSALVEQQLQMSPFDDALFVFVNRQRDKIKALYWHRNGFCLWYKRLEKERFAWPALQASQRTCTLSMRELEWLLEGFDLWRNRPHQTLHYQSTV